jgi:hypothetical protein
MPRFAVECHEVPNGETAANLSFQEKRATRS